jgi:hypothetical protein
MVRVRWPFIAACVLGTTALTSGVARASDAQVGEARGRLIPYRAVEVQGLVITQLLPRPGFGVDGAFVLGTSVFQLRLGALLAGSPGFRLGSGKIANILGAGQVDMCVAKNVVQHQIRMCMGGQGGAMAHRWIDFPRPGRDVTPWAAGTLKADYRLALGERFGILGGVGVIVPVVGPSFRASDELGAPSPLILPGPVAGFVSLGTSWRW